MALALLRGKVEREGFLKKCASAKGKDEVRGKWQERWFMLKGYSLEYYKKKGDSTPKGIVDMRAAKVDEADDTTGLDFTIRIAQSKQIFTYIQCSHQQDRQEWLTALRKSAGYKVSEIRTSQMAPKSQKHAYASFGVLHALSATSSPVETVLVIDVDDKSIKLFDHGEITKVYPHYQITLVTPSKIASRPSHTTDPMFKLTLDMKAENYLSRKVLWVATEKTLECLSAILSQISQGNFSQAIAMQQLAPVRSGSMQMQTQDIWMEVWVVLLAEKLLVFTNRNASIPYRVLQLDEVSVHESSLTGLDFKRKSGSDVSMRFSDTVDRDAWKRGMQIATKNMKDQLVEDMKTAMNTDVSLNSKIPVHLKASDTNSSSSQQTNVRGQVRWSQTATAVNLRDDEASFVLTWGCGTDGQLGHRTRDNMTRVEVVKALSSKRVRCVSGGFKHSGAVTTQGHVYMWGSGADGQLGLGQNLKQSSSPYLVTSLRTTAIMQIALGRAHSYALSVDGHVYAWGSSKHGQLGLGGQDAQNYPQIIRSLEKKGVDIRRIASGNDHGIALDVNGVVFTWGYNEFGQLGLGHTNDIATPTKCTSLSSTCREIACGGDTSGFILDDNHVYLCGANNYGQLGQGDQTHRNTPTEVKSIEQNAQLLTLGDYTTFVVTDDGQAYTWGRSVYNGLQTDQSIPTPLRGLDPIKYCDASGTHTLLVDKSLRVYAFGQNEFGELGNGQPHLLGLTSVAISPALQAVQVACGQSTSMILVRGQVPNDIGNNRKTEPIQVQQSTVNEAKLPITAADMAITGAVNEETANKKITELLGALESASITTTTTTEEKETTVVDDGKSSKKKKKKKGVWRGATEQSTGRTYYYNKKTRETRWIKPEEMIQEEAEADE